MDFLSKLNCFLKNKAYLFTLHESTTEDSAIIHTNTMPLTCTYKMKHTQWKTHEHTNTMMRIRTIALSLWHITIYVLSMCVSVTHTLTHTRTPNDTHKDTQTHTNTHTHKNTQKHKRTQFDRHTDTHWHTLTHTQSDTHTHTLTHTNTQNLTHTQMIDTISLI